MSFIINPYVFATAGGAPSEVPYTTGLVLALEADHITGLSDGNNVLTWPDYSPNLDNPTATGTDGAPPAVANT